MSEVALITLRCAAVVLCIVLTVKLVEMLRLILWTVRSGAEFIDRLDLQLLSPARADELLETLLGHGYPLYPERSIFIALVGRAVGAERAIRLSAHFFRYPTLMILSALVAGLWYDAITWRVLAPVLFAGIWIWIGQMLSMRFVFGPVHTILEVPCMAPTRWQSHLGIGAHTPLRFFITMYAASYVVLVLGYAAIYCGIAAGGLAFSAMRNMDPSVPAFLESTYFSAATLLTVGYGDVTVAGPLGRIIALSHMSAGFILLVLLLTAFSGSQSVGTTRSPQDSGPA